MNQKTKTYLFWALGIVIVTGLVWWGQARQQTGDQESIRIGAILLLSGLGSSWGENSRLGAELAVSEINSAGGIDGKSIEILYEDNQGDDPKAAVSALNKFIQNGVTIVLGPNWTPSGLAVAPLACDNEVLMISPSVGVAEFSEHCDSVFNLWVSDDLVSRELGRHIASQGYKKLAVLGSLQEWDKAQAEAVREGFEESGISVVSFQLGAPGQTDYRSELTKIKSQSPDAIALTNFGGGGVAHSAIQISELGLDVPLFSVALDNETVGAAKGALEEAVVATSFTPTPEFSVSFVEAYGREPDTSADTSYDAVMLIADAIRETGSIDPDVLKDYLNSLNEYDGASGQIEFDDHGGVVKDPRFVVVREGELVQYDPTN